MNFRKVNNIVGWATGAIATLVYLITMEPTVSYWDCGEFISCAYNIEVGHSPGAPLFMMIQRMFGMLAGSDVTKVAMYTNAWSAIASGLTILFLFWTITHFAKRLLVPNRDDEPTGNQMLMIMGAGLVGGLAYTFSDTFWFSAVEAEVYATSSFFTALVFWAILKWEHIADRPNADRWLVLIAYLMGLSVGIHLLNLLAIPAVAMVYYYRRYEATTSGSIIAFIIGCALLGLVQFGVLQGLPILASKFDLLFVNSFHLPFDSGALTFIILLMAVLISVVVLARRKGWYLLHTGMLCLIFIIIGFSSYLAPMIRSRADVPIDMTNPDNAISLTSYIQREQFGSQPLLSGPYFTSQPIELDRIGKKYARSQKDGKDFYKIVGEKKEYKYASGDKHFFPRIWDANDPQHVRFYKNYLNLQDGEEPTSADNLKFFMGYQIDWMWWRYFMWNYAGRQNDMEGQGNPKDGNWVSGIKVFDKNFRGLGDMDLMQDGYVNNRARNQFYFLPFILGILGMVFQFNRNKKDGIVTLVLFFFTGIAIAIYLNMPPLQPRERDYAFAGSTYTYAIWIGLGVLMVGNLFNKFLKGATGGAVAIILCLLAVPTLMAKEGWDDHDRSNKYLAHSTAYNTLMSCEKNAILFTFGDNDTYPLWYLQEVERVRTDVRIINMSLLGIDWYIDQLNNKMNDAPPVPMVWDRDAYIGDRSTYLFYNKPQNIPEGQYFKLMDVVKFMSSNDRRNQVPTRGGDYVNFMPTKNMTIPSLTKEDLINKGFISAKDTANISTDIRFTFPKNNALKDDIATLNIVAAISDQGWDRPIYFSGGLPGDNYIGMQDYMRLEGVVYRLLPFKMLNNPPAVNPGDIGSVDLDKSLDLFTNVYKWGNAGQDNVYYDEKNRLMFSAYRMNSSRIATQLAQQGRTKEANAILDTVFENISERSYYYDATAYFMAVAYYSIGNKEKGRIIADKLVKNAEDDVNYIMSLDEEDRPSLTNDAQRDLSLASVMQSTAQAAGDTEAAAKYGQKAQEMATKLQSFMRFQ